jgi:hypothetical protein
MESPTQCSVCGSKNIRAVIEWGDTEGYEQVVPMNPTGEEDMWTQDHHGNKYAIRIPIYDVSRLFNRGKEG